MSVTSRKKFYRLEKIFKGIANHRRIEMLYLISRRSNLSVEDIVSKLDINYQTGSSHLRKLVKAGLVNGVKQGRRVEYVLSPYGDIIITFLKKLK